MNIGIIADVHGNYNALKSVLKNGRLVSLGGIFRIEDNIYLITG
jgi:fructose-1,6-bisphosphatase